MGMISLKLIKEELNLTQDAFDKLHKLADKLVDSNMTEEFELIKDAGNLLNKRIQVLEEAIQYCEEQPVFDPYTMTIRDNGRR